MLNITDQLLPDLQSQDSANVLPTGGSLGGSIGSALLVNGLRHYLPTNLPPLTAMSILESVEAIWTLSGTAQAQVITAYARALDDVFLIGAAAGILGVLFALLCRDIK